MEMLERIYAETSASLAKGDLTGAEDCMARAARELRAIALARGLSASLENNSSHPLGQPPQISKPSDVRRIVSREDLDPAALQRARSRLAALAAQVDELRTMAENNHARVQQKRKLHAVFEGRRSAAGTLLDRNG